MGRLELEFDLQGKICKAALRLTQDHSVAKSVRKARKQSYHKAHQKVCKSLLVIDQLPLFCLSLPGRPGRKQLLVKLDGIIYCSNVLQLKEMEKKLNDYRRHAGQAPVRVQSSVEGMCSVGPTITFGVTKCTEKCKQICLYM